MLAIAAVAAFFTSNTANGQQCATNGGSHYDSSGQTQEVTCGSRAGSLFAVTFSGRRSALQTNGCGFIVLDANGTGVTSGSASNPFGNSSAYPHNEHRTRHVAVLDDFPFGYMSHSSEGWATFKMNTNGSGQITSIQNVDRFYFGDGMAPVTSQYVYGGRLFRAGGRVYVVGRYLDKSTPTLRIADFGTGASNPPMTIVATLSQVEAAPGQYEIIEAGGSVYLYAFDSAGAKIFNVTTPSNPVYLGANSHTGFLLPSASQPDYPRGTAVADSGGGKRLYTWKGALYAFDVSNPASPQFLFSYGITNGGGPFAGMSCDGSLLALMTAKSNGTPMIRYFSVTQDTVRELTHSINWNSATDSAFNTELPMDVLLIPPTSALPNAYKAIRTYWTKAWWDTISTSCLSTTPTAGVGVTRMSSTGTTSCTSPHPTAVKGFPGDQFKIANTSTGLPVPTVQSVVITDVATSGATYTLNVPLPLTNNEYTWTAPADATGEYQVTLTLNEAQTPATQYIMACNDPDADLVVSHYSTNGTTFNVCNNCTWLQGYSLRFSGLASEGSPAWGSSQWTVEHRPTGGSYGTIGDFVNNNNGTIDLPLALTGDYKVTLNPEYGYADSSPEKTDFVEVHSGAITATISVTQNSQNVADGATVLRSQPLGLTRNTQCADGQNCTFTWSGSPAIPCTTEATCTIPGNSLSAGLYTITLTGGASPSGDSAVDTHNVNVSDCASPSAATNTTPSNGASVSAGSVQLGWTAASGTPTITYTVKNTIGATLCGPTTGTFCSINVNSGTTNWFVEATNSCGTTTSSPTSFSVAGSNCTAPGTPAQSSPSNGATVNPGSVTFSWSTVSGSSPITYAVKNAFGTTLCSSSGSSCSASVSAGSLNWFVQASNSCGSASSGTRSLTVVNTNCTAPGTPSQTSPANAASVSAGSVQFSWTAVSGTAPITYTVRKSPFGDALCTSTGTSCAGTVSANISWWVEAANDCGSTQSSSRSLTVGPACTAPGAATLVAPADSATGTGATVTLQWTAPATGTTPFNYDVFLDGSPVAACQNLTTTSCQLTGLAINQSSHSWYVRTENTCGSSTGVTRTFKTCGANAVPAGDFTWSPTGTLTMANGYQQAQPYVGQLVTLTNTSTNGPFTDVSWYDFGVPGGVGYIKTTDTSYAWPTAGNKTVRLTVTNCFGQASEKAKVVAVAADNRPVIADFTVSPGTLPVNTLLTFTAMTGPLYGDPDEFTWKFSDEESTRSGASITRTFTCAKSVSLQLTSRSTTRNKTSTPVTKSAAINGEPMCCTNTQGPNATFAWQETGNLMFQGVAQPQPYVGQTVHFTDPSPNNATSWRWEIATQPTESSPIVVKTEHLPTYVFSFPGNYKVKFIPSNCFGPGAATEKTITVYADQRKVTSDFTWTPGGAPSGTPITFTAKDGFDYGDPTVFEWSFPNNVKKSGKVVTHAFTCGGLNQVTLVSKRETVASDPTSKSVTTTGEPSCCKPPNRAVSPVPVSGATIPGGTVTLQWGRPTQGSDPLTYDVYLDGVKLPECSNLVDRVCTTTVEEGTATRFWKVIAKNDCGDTTTYPDTPSEWRFKACSASSAPDATAFTWDKTGAVDVQGVVQQQPYVGQTVTFSYDPTVPATQWSWTDYQVSPAVTYEVANPEVVYGSPGRKKMYLRVSNCAGTRSITQYIDIFADQRPVEARFAFAPAAPGSLEPVTFTFDTSDEVGNPNEFTIDFGDGTPPLTTTETTAQHAFGCGKLYRVTVTAKRNKPGSSVASQPHTEDLQVSGYPCSAFELVVVDMTRQLVRATGVVERGDMVLFNPTDDLMQLEMAVRNTDTGQVTAGIELPPLPPQGTMMLADILALKGLDFSSATLWFKRAEEGADTLPVVNAWKYLEPTAGAKYGQFLPVFAVWPASDQTTSRWITGLIHNSLNAERGHYGFISKLTFVDPTLKDPERVPWGTKKLILRLYDNQTGQLLRTDSLNLDNYGGYRHDYLNRIFHLSDGQDLKAVTVQVEVPPGVSVLVTSSMFDNYTENAVVFPSQTAQ